MPAWDAKTKEWVRQGKLVVLGIVQEQHDERTRLFAQWQQLRWPILHDPINLMQVTGVPIIVAIDESGVVRSLSPNLNTLEQDFLERTFPSASTAPPAVPPEPAQPDLMALRARAEQDGSCQAWRDLGDALALWAGPDRIDEAIHAYTRALQARPDDGDAHFRLGVCYCIRSESDHPTLGDFQAAVDHWTTARALQPSRYIWRRRIEQYGPRLTKPYPYYDWVAPAIRAIQARGEQPVELKVALTDSEMAGPLPKGQAEPGAVPSPDPENRIARDTQNLVQAEMTVVPSRVKPGEAVRVHVQLRPNAARSTHWDSESEPPRVWLDLPAGWRAQPQLLIASPDRPNRSQTQHVEGDIVTPAAANSTARLIAVAVYRVREGTDGTSRLLRQDIPITIATAQ